MTRAAVWKLLDRAEEGLAGVLLLAVMAITLYNVVNRYLLQLSTVWAPELAGFLFTWVVFIGASAAARRGMHVSIGIVVDRLPSAARRVTLMAGELILIAFFSYALWLSLKITITSYSRVSPALHLPFSFIYSSVVVCFALCLGRNVAALLQRRQSPPQSGTG
jgi:TRAP-type C4-dicarboxylate transport system permease small subunit